MRAPAEQVIVDVDSNFQWPFEVKTIIVDNLTDHYAYSPDAQRFIQPNIAGLVLPIHPTQTPKLLWKAPPGKTQPALASNAQELTIVFVDSLFPPTSGSTVVAAVTSTWPDGTAALPGFANQNDLSLGLFRKAANQLGFSVAGVEQLELDVTGAALKDGTAANPSLHFITDLTSGLAKLAATTLSVSLNGIERSRFGILGAAGTVQTIISSSGTASAYTHYGDVAGSFGFVTGQAVTAAAHQYEIYDSSAGVSLLLLSQTINDFLRLGANPAGTGLLRLANSGPIVGRNGGNTADVEIARVLGNSSVSIDNGAVGTVIGGFVNVVGASLSISSPASTTGSLRLANLASGGSIKGRNAGNTGDRSLVALNGADNVSIGEATAYPDFAQALVGLGGGAAPTLGTIGGTGPTAAAQVGWVQIFVNGTKTFIAAWR